MLSKQHLSMFIALLVICLLFSTEAWATPVFKKTSLTLGVQPLTFAPASKVAPKPTQPYSH